MACAGVVVLSADGKQCVLVKSRGGKYGFCKGKPDGKEKGASFETACRELKEESGILPAQLNFAYNRGSLIYLDEINEKGNLSVRYYLATFKGSDHAQHKFSHDEAELQGVNWHSITDALKIPAGLFRPRRKALLKSALSLAPRSQFMSAEQKTTTKDKVQK